LVLAEADGAVLLHATPQLLHRRLVIRVGGADEVVVGDLDRLPGRAVGVGELVGERARGDARLVGEPRDLLAVVVGAGEKPGRLPAQAVVARERVGDDGGVGVPEMRHVRDVVDGCGDVEAIRHGEPKTTTTPDGQRKGVAYSPSESAGSLGE